MTFVATNIRYSLLSFFCRLYLGNKYFCNHTRVVLSPIKPFLDSKKTVDYG